MLRTILMVLALVVLVVIGLFYMRILHWPGSGQPIQANPVEVKMETRQVNMQVPVVGTAGEPGAANAAQPGAAPAPAPQPQPAPTK
jgi:hypothetical protein